MANRTCFPKENHEYDGYLPEEPLIEILIKLPIKTIFMLKCVSKRWNFLICDPIFAKSYISRRNNTSSSQPWTILTARARNSYYENYSDQTKLVRLYSDEDYKSPTVSVLAFPFSGQQNHEPFSESCRIRASSNGLLLCYAIYTSTLYVCNPLTRQWVALPAPPNYVCTSIYEAFVTQLHGADVTSYKVIRFSGVFQCHTNSHIMEIFHSETGVWRPQKVKTPQKILVNRDGKIPTSFNGIVHWFVKCSTSRRQILLAYDPYKNTDQCRLIELPILSNDRINDMCGVSQGHLQYIRTEFDGLQVWVLEDYDSGKWNLEYNISWDGNPKEVICLNPFDSGIVYVSCMNKILRKNTRNGNLEVICDFVYGEIYRYFSLVLPFVLPLWPPSVPHSSS